jgi:hypothetical protein
VGGRVADAHGISSRYGRLSEANTAYVKSHRRRKSERKPKRLMKPTTEGEDR